MDVVETTTIPKSDIDIDVECTAKTLALVLKPHMPMRPFDFLLAFY